MTDKTEWIIGEREQCHDCDDSYYRKALSELSLAKYKALFTQEWIIGEERPIEPSELVTGE